MNKIKFVNQSDLYTAVLEIWTKACDRFMVKGYIRVQPTANSLTYTGVAQALCTAGIGSGTIVYSLDGSTYTTTIPSQTNAGTYTVYYKALSSFDSTESPVYTLNCGIDKATPTVVVPTAKVLTYNGSAQELLNAGSTDLGTLKYSLDNSTWSTSIPTATNGGSYTAYYKVEGDSNINDVASTSVQCSINEKQPTITIELSQDTYTYDGTAKTPTVTVKDGATTIDPSEYTVTYSNNTNAGTATVTITDNVGGNYNVIGSTTFTINKANRTASFDGNSNNYEYVDLGLPSGTKWATMNVGASSATAVGNYYMYGKGSAVYDSSDTAYTGTEEPLSTSVDTARLVCGGDWTTPTKEQWEELLNNTTLTTATVDGVAGYKFTGTNNNYIFIPSGGYYYNGDISAYGTAACCWTSTQYNSNFSYIIKTNELPLMTASRTNGYNVRGVLSSSYKSTLNVGNTDTITVYTQGTPTITLSSSDTSVATVSGMTVTAVGGGTTTITATIAGDSNYNSTSISYTLTVNDPYVGHDYVEIGGLKWATMNIGASSVTNYGKHFQWGDIQGYTDSEVGSGSGLKYFGWADYKYGNGTSSPDATDITKYNSTDGKTILDLSDDAARANWGGAWRMPTADEFQALGAAVNTAWTTNYNSSGVVGLICTDKTDSSKVLFFPAGGYFNNGNVGFVGSRGCYLSSSLNASLVKQTTDLYFTGSRPNWKYPFNRNYGSTVRPVAN